MILCRKQRVIVWLIENKRLSVVHIIQINPTDTYKLRLEVLKTNEKYIYKYKGDFNEETIHYGAFEGTKNVGIVTLMENNNPLIKGKQIQLRGMAVVTNTQSKGIGRELVKKAIEISIKKGAKKIWCNARENVIEFYKKQGFKIEGERFYIKNVCNHYLMIKQL